MQRPDYRPEYRYDAPEVQVAYDWLRELQHTKHLGISFAPLPEVYRAQFDDALNHMMAATFSPPTSVLKKMVADNLDLIDRLDDQLMGHAEHLSVEVPDLAERVAEFKELNGASGGPAIDFRTYKRIVCAHKGEGFGPIARAFEQQMALSMDPAAALVPMQRMLCDMRDEYDGIDRFLNNEYADTSPYITPSTNPPPVHDHRGHVTVTGVVKDQETMLPVKQALVMLDKDRKAVTDQSGRFTIPQVPTGLYTVTATATLIARKMTFSEPREIKLPAARSIQPIQPEAVQDLGDLLLSYHVDPFQSLMDGASGLGPGASGMFADARHTIVNDCLKNRGLNIEGFSWHPPDPPINFQIGNILWAKLKTDWNMLVQEVGGLFVAISLDFLEALKRDLIDFLGKSICDARTLALIVAADCSEKGLGGRWHDFYDGVIGGNFGNKLNQGEVVKKIQDWQKAGTALMKDVDQVKQKLGQLGDTISHLQMEKVMAKAWEAFLQFMNQMKDEILGLGASFLQQMAMNFLANMLCLNLSTLMACVRQAQETIAYLPTREKGNGRIPAHWDSLTIFQKQDYLDKEFPLKDYMPTQDPIVDQADQDLRDLQMAEAEQRQAEDIGRELVLFRERQKTDAVVKTVYDVMMGVASKTPNAPVNIGLSSLPTANRMMMNVTSYLGKINMRLEDYADHLFMGTSISSETRARLVGVARELLFLRQLYAALTDAEVLKRFSPEALAKDVEQIRTAGAQALTPPKE